MTSDEMPAEARHRATDEPGSHGLFDGFTGYRTPSRDDYRRLLTEGLVVPDTNVLLNLYRYNTQTQVDLFAVLDRLGERLWVPHQVLKEFRRNRESALKDPQDTAEATVAELESLCEQALQALRTWANRVALPSDRFIELQDTLEHGFTVVTDTINGLIDVEAIKQAQDTNRDPVLKRLEPLLKGRVGSALDREAHAQAVREGLERVAKGQPPGYQDTAKNRVNDAEGAAGDYLLWEQVLREAERRLCDVLLVTGDVKDDWWRKARGLTRGPRLELVEEMSERAGVQLFMLRPESLLVHARQVLEVKVRDESVEDVGRVERSHSTGWTTEALRELLDRLSIEGHVQAAVIQRAAEGDGFVQREEVYAFGGYDKTRTLKGFTRPVNRLAQEFRDRGVVPDSAVDILEAVYDSSPSWTEAKGFAIPQALIPLIRDAYKDGWTV